MKYYKSINNLPVFYFYKILDTKNINYLIKKYNPKKDLNITLAQKEILEKTFESIVLEFNSKNVTTKSIRGVKKKATIAYMESVYSTTVFLLKTYSETKDIKLLLSLVDLDWQFDSLKPIEPQIELILKKLKGLKNKIKISKISYSKEFGTVEKDDENVSFMDSMDKQAIHIERVLETKYCINLKKTSLLRWCNLIETCKQQTQNG